MKKTFLVLAAALTACTTVLSSCAGNKTETETTETDEVIIETATEPEEMPEKAALREANLVNTDDFNKTIFIDFNATWCGPCRQFAPYFKEAAEKYGNEAKFIEVDIDKYPQVAETFGIRSIPTLIALKPDGTMAKYNGTQELVGDGVFEAIVNKNK